MPGDASGRLVQMPGLHRFFIPDAHNRAKLYSGDKVGCWHESKAASQRAGLSKPGHADRWEGEANVFGGARVAAGASRLLAAKGPEPSRGVTRSYELDKQRPGRADGTALPGLRFFGTRSGAEREHTPHERGLLSF